MREGGREGCLEQLEAVIGFAVLDGGFFIAVIFIDGPDKRKRAIKTGSSPDERVHSERRRRGLVFWLSLVPSRSAHARVDRFSLIGALQIRLFFVPLLPI